MAKGEKRSFDQMEGSFDYVLSENDHCNLKKMWRLLPPFPIAETPVPPMPESIKIAAIQASFHVVSLISFSGDDVLSAGCGTIFETEENNNVVMTSLNLIRCPTEDEKGICSLVDNYKIIVNFDDDFHVAEMCAYDFHYNLLFIKFKSKTPLQPAKLQFYPTCKPGDDRVIVVGQHFYKPYQVMAATGGVSMDCYNPRIYDCRELFSTNCFFSQCGEGAPLINLSGEVLGMVYYGLGRRPVMPIQLIYKWWERYKISGKKCHPFYGFEACNFYSAALSRIDRVVKQFPSISNGLVVEKVSCTQCQLREDDVIVKCDDKFVESLSELWDLMCEKIGQIVKLLVARIDVPSLISIDIPVLEATKVNDWPWFGLPC